MSRFAEPMTRLIDELKKLPGIGSKSAQRLAFHILRSSDEDAEGLATAVRDVKANLRLCSICNNITEVDPCLYCGVCHACRAGRTSLCPNGGLSPTQSERPMTSALQATMKA